MSDRMDDGTCWVERKEDKTYRIGLLEKSVKDADEFVFVQLPEPGEKVSGGDVCITLESSKSTSEVESPLSGKVVSKNKEVFLNPAMLNENPRDAWLFEVEVSDMSEIEALRNK